MAEYLLDTCAWLDALLAPEKLAPKAKKILAGPQVVFLSAISLVELARKEAHPKGNEGDIILSMPCQDWLNQVALPSDKIKVLPIVAEVAVEAFRLPGQFVNKKGEVHNDPADRLISATARHYGLVLLTSDQILLEYSHVRTVKSRR